MIVFSDVHLTEDSARTVFDDVLPGIRQAALENDKLIACLGDFWSIRYQVNVALLNRVIEVLEDWHNLGLKTTFLPGNHDQVTPTGENALEVLAHVPGVRVYSVPTVDEHGLWIPYRKDQGLVLQALKDHAARGRKRAHVLWLHQGIQGAWKNENFADADGLERSAFGGFKLVLSGHYHKRQQLPGLAKSDIFYVGSPYQTRVDESGQAKGYAVLEKGEFYYVTKNWGPKYYKIHLASGEFLDLGGVTPADDVRVTVASGVDPAQVGAQLAAMKLEHFSVTPDQESSEQRLDVVSNAALHDYAVAYVDRFAAGLDGEQLMRVFGELTS